MILFFQAILHHLFVGLLEHLDDIIAEEGSFSVEFSVLTTPRKVSVSFWEGNEFVTMVIAHYGTDVFVIKSNVALIARLLSVTSINATTISSGGSSSKLK